MTTRLLTGDCRPVLATLPADSVHCCITSPPYWGLRDYGVAGQLGLEPTFTEFIDKMVEVFREVRRVLRPDGTLWLNLGDSYNAGRNGGHAGGRGALNTGRNLDEIYAKQSGVNAEGLKPKDLCGIPWRVAFALQADGWWLRQDIIWSKPNPMPESVTDRCTKAHEYLFLLTKSARYFYDAEAIREPAEYGRRDWNGEQHFKNGDIKIHHMGKTTGADPSAGRNKRSVWEIATAPFPEAHFATFPPALVEPCIKAGTSEKGCCAKCGAPWERVVERTAMVLDRSERTHDRGQTRSSGTMLEPPQSKTLGWQPTCTCHGHFEERDGPEDWISRETGERKKISVYVPDEDSPPPKPCTVLDPFGGAGTTGLVADRLQRNAILIELNPAYAEMASRRLFKDSPLFAEISA